MGIRIGVAVFVMLPMISSPNVTAILGKYRENVNSRHNEIFKVVKFHDLCKL